MKDQILIIEDEEDILELMEYRLTKEGYEVNGFLSTKNVEHFLLEEHVDLLIVDRNLPGVEGSEFVKQLRDEGYEMPVIFVTAKVEDSDIEEGFLSGGDDYLKKPFNMNELVLRVKALIHRTKKSQSALLRYRDIVVDTPKRELFVDKKLIPLSRLEFELILYFIKHRDRIITRDELLESVWQSEDERQIRTVNVAINRLLKKLDPKREKNYIEAIRGVGYKLKG